tara:strand:- start:5076 stop:5531 length:456 start_codon:yes stop_codon:yes gene_type:complete
MKQIVIQENSFEKARKEIKKSPDKTIIFTGADDDLNRKILEKEKVDIFMPLLLNKKDFQKQRNSGFNHVLAKIAKKNHVSIGINLDEVIMSNGKIKSDVLSRIKQNIKLCNKNKLKMTFVFSDKNKRDIHDLKALGLVLGMPTWMTKSLNF